MSAWTSLAAAADLFTSLSTSTGEHQMELLDCVAAKFHEEPGVFKLLVHGNYHVQLCNEYFCVVTTYLILLQ